MYQWRRQSAAYMAGHRQVIRRISKGSQNIFIILLFDYQGGSQGRGISTRAFALAGLGVATPLLHVCVYIHVCI